MKLFKKLNWLDCLFILLLVAAIAIGAWRVAKVISPSGDIAGAGQTKEVLLSVKFHADEARNEIADLLTVDGPVYNRADKILIGTLKGFERTAPTNWTATNDGQWVNVQREGFTGLDLTVEVEARIDEETGIFYVGEKAFIINTGIETTFSGAIISSRVVKIDIISYVEG